VRERLDEVEKTTWVGIKSRVERSRKRTTYAG